MPYRRLARHLDDLPGGFPATETGVELRILRRLFTPEQAELAVHLTLIPEEARVVSRRAGLSPEKAEKRLEEMALKGLVFRVHRDGRPPLYMAAQFVIGIWEYHVNDLDEDLIRDMNAYIPTLFDPSLWKKAPQLRTVPVGRSLRQRPEILAHENVEHLVRQQRKFLVAPCICRREHRIMGRGCDHPEETCLVFGTGADYYESNGLGRRIDLQETLDILHKAEEAGLVLQPSNARRVVNICTCCGCCCQVLKTFKRYPRPAELVSSPFSCSLDAASCKRCGLCAERCPMEALTLQGEDISLNPERCIGCGVCVARCPTKSLSLVRKPQPMQKDVPRDMIDAGIRLGRSRGKLTPLSLAKMQLKSKVDRLLAGR